MSNYYAEQKLHEIMEEYQPCPVDLCLVILENYALENGVKGKDQFQDALGEAWAALRTAYFLKKGEKDD